MSRLLAALVVLALAASARVAAADDRPQPHSKRLARELSLGGVGFSLAAIGLGIEVNHSRGHDAGNALIELGAVSTMITPQLGSLYNGEVWTLGTTLRSGGVVLGGLAVVSALQDFCLGGEDCPRDNGPAILLGLGATLYAAGILHDVIAGAPNSTDRYNRRHHLELVPTVMPAAYGTSAPGAGMRITF